MYCLIEEQSTIQKARYHRESCHDPCPRFMMSFQLRHSGWRFRRLSFHLRIEWSKHNTEHTIPFPHFFYCQKSRNLPGQHTPAFCIGRQHINNSPRYWTILPRNIHIRKMCSGTNRPPRGMSYYYRELTKVSVQKSLERTTITRNKAEKRPCLAPLLIHMELFEKKMEQHWCCSRWFALLFRLTLDGLWFFNSNGQWQMVRHWYVGNTAPKTVSVARQLILEFTVWSTFELVSLVIK